LSGGLVDESLKKINWQQERLKFLQARVCSLLEKGCEALNIGLHNNLKHKYNGKERKNRRSSETARG
jgi:hypothetical protein